MAGTTAIDRARRRAWSNNPNPTGYPKTWKEDRSRRLVKDNYQCQVKGPECLGRANQVDHIDGDVWNLDDKGHAPLSNLRSVCQKCHNKITAQNAQDSRNRSDPRQSPESPGVILSEAPKELEIIDDETTDDETKWFTSFGPVYEKLETGGWKRPTHSLGYTIIKWVVENLRIKGEPFRFTAEQARSVIWMYAIRADGKWEYKKTLHIAPKGIGKDPFGAALCCVELCGPARFSHFNEQGVPIPKRQENAWVQIAAENMAQNQNTMAYLRDMFSKEAAVKYSVDLNEETIYSHGRRSKIELVSATSSGKEGNFPTFAMLSETQHMKASNGGHKLYDVITRNLTKVANSHYYMTTNAYDPNEDSVAQRQFENWEKYMEGKVKNPRLLVIMRSATHKAPYETMEQRMKILGKLYGDAGKYTDLEEIAAEFDDASKDVTQLKRFYYNTIGIPSTAWVDVRDWKACETEIPADGVPYGTNIVLAADLSKNDDSTGIVGIVVGGKYDKTVLKLGLWEKTNYDEDEWKVPRHEVDDRVREIFKRYKVLAFWVDPSHRMDESGGGSYWLPLVNEWHRLYSRRLQYAMWAKNNEHSTNFDMTVHGNQRDFITALGALEQEITDKSIRHDGDSDLTRHIGNARRFASKRFGQTIAKENPQSRKKIDLAVTLGIAYLMYSKITTKRGTRTQNIRGYQANTGK